MPTPDDCPFSELSTADLVVDAVYQAGDSRNIGSDPLARLLPVGNQGGFRIAGGRDLPECRLAVLFSNLAEPNWPDSLDLETGRFTYFGDNRKPGKELHDTARGGNALLRACFNALHSDPPRRELVPPFFVFSVANGRDVRFRGLAVPGFSGVPATDDLVAIWKVRDASRFQNYRATFTVLNVPTVSRAWIRDILAGAPRSVNAPGAFIEWVGRGRYRPLEALRTVRWRSREEQLPSSVEARQIVGAVYDHFAPRPTEFEKCAALLARWVAPATVSIDVTRPWMDGGRDAVGQYRIGTGADAINVEYALEAKCFALEHGVGVRATSRLISRLRYRQFGILVTTSFLSQQAYQEIRQDGHPIIVISAVDISRLFMERGVTTSVAVAAWLTQNFPCEPDESVESDAF